MTEQETPDQPDVGTGAEDQDSNAELKERLTKLEEQGTALQTSLDKEKETSRKLQASRDRERARLERLQTERKRQTSRSGTVDELRTLANDKTREAMLLRALMDANLTEEDLREAGVEPESLTTPAEVRNAVQLANLEKEIADQGQQLEQLREVGTQQEGVEEHLEETSDASQDTGGPSAPAPETDSSEPSELMKRAQEIKDNAMPHDDATLKEARYLTLEASYRDPSKTIGRGRGGETREG